MNDLLSRLIKIHPQIDFSTYSPDGSSIAYATSWSIAGPWILAKCDIESGSRPFYTELPWSMGVQAPISIDAQTGVITSSPLQAWRTDSFNRAWHHRSNDPIDIKVESRRAFKHAILFNCLYPWWADSISLLWRVNQLKDYELPTTGFGIIALITPDLKWLVPPEVDELWIIPKSQVNANKWNESLDSRLHAMVSNFHTCYIPRLWQPARATVEQVKANTGIQPFPRNDWIDRLIEKPTITFMYRPDRCWGSYQFFINKFLRLVPSRPSFLRFYCHALANRFNRFQQKKNIISLANILRKTFGSIEFAIAGTNTEVSFPDWFVDIRSDSPGETSNRASAKQCSRSHLMICVGGSHMYLPSAFSGGVIMITSYPEWGDFQTGWLLTSNDPCEAQFLYRTISERNPPKEVANMAISLLLNYPIQYHTYHNSFAHPLNVHELDHIRSVNQKRLLVYEQVKSNVNIDIIRA